MLQMSRFKQEAGGEGLDSLLWIPGEKHLHFYLCHETVREDPRYGPEGRVAAATATPSGTFCTNVQIHKQEAGGEGRAVLAWFLLLAPLLRGLCYWHVSDRCFECELCHATPQAAPPSTYHYIEVEPVLLCFGSVYPEFSKEHSKWAQNWPGKQGSDHLRRLGTKPLDCKRVSE